jgi:hypothetical protein
MTPTILVALGALVMAALAGALLAPPSPQCARAAAARSQWPELPAPMARRCGGLV